MKYKLLIITVTGVVVTGLALFLWLCPQPFTIFGYNEAEIAALDRAYHKAIESGIHGNSYPAQFNQLFPGASNIISYFTGTVGDTQWASKAGLFGRYLLTMTAPIRLSQDRTSIVFVGEPSFFLQKFESITPLSGGRWTGKSDMAAYKRFGLEAWKLLCNAKGDFKVIGIEIDKRGPIPNFEETWSKF